MELNANEIIKALEWCSSGGNCMKCAEDGKNPHLSKEGCMAVQMRNALALIKELTEANERYHSTIVEATKQVIENNKLLDMLNNEILKMITRSRNVRADTVRKIFGKLESKLRIGFINGDEENAMLIIGYDDYDAIKKEMGVNPDE